jgi:hypothetical protein
LVSEAANPDERAKLERAWAEYRWNLQNWEKDEGSRKRSDLSKKQTATRETQKDAEVQNISDRLKRQEEAERIKSEQNRARRKKEEEDNEQAGMSKLGAGAYEYGTDAGYKVGDRTGA